jgi:hypothetical protein
MNLLNKKHSLTSLAILSLSSIIINAQEITPHKNPGDWIKNISPAKSDNSWGAGVSVSTLGLGGHITYEINEKFYIKGALKAISYDKDLDLGNVNYDGELDFLSFGLTGNYLPFADSAAGKGFRISFGAYTVSNDISIDTSSPGQSINIGGLISYTLQAGDSITGDVSYPEFAPYLGLGWDWQWGEEKQYILSLDAGVLFLGSPDVNLTPNSAILGSVPFVTLNNEEQDIIDDLEDFPFYPVISLGFTWKF